MCGSAICARVMPTRSAAPLASTRSAWLASRMLCACMTGIFTTDLMPADRCTKGSGGSAIGGIQLASVLCVSAPEPITLR